MRTAFPAEEEKEARLKGFYTHPELYGAPFSQSESAANQKVVKLVLEKGAAR